MGGQVGGWEAHRFVMLVWGRCAQHLVLLTQCDGHVVMSSCPSSYITRLVQATSSIGIELFESRFGAAFRFVRLIAQISEEIGDEERARI